MKIENEILLDFKDVLIRPKRSTLASRSEVSVERTFKFLHSDHTWTGVPIIAANMDTVGTFAMYEALKDHKMMTALHKHHSETDLMSHFMTGINPEVAVNHAVWERQNLQAGPIDPPAVLADAYLQTNQSQFSFYSMGISNAEYLKFHKIMGDIGFKSKLDYFDDRSGAGRVNRNNPLKFVCVDVANGYTENFVNYIKRLRGENPNIVIMAGNVVTAEMTEQLILAGADIVKVGIGPGSVCTTRKMTGVGYPQLSAIIECADAAHGLGGLICSDGGCTVPGDIAKAFGAGADFVMLGGMLAGHDQSGGEYIAKHFLTNELDSDGKQYVETKEYKRFYGMSSDTAMNKHNGGVASYRASEGKTVEVEFRGDVNDTARSILGGLRSAMTYIGASKLKDMSKRTTFVRVTQQLNEVFGKSK